MVAFVAAILAGLIPSPVEAVQPPVPNLNPSIERTLSNQELDSLDDPNSQAILTKTGDSTTLSIGRGQPSHFPTPPSRGQPRRPVYVPKYRTAAKVVDQGLGAVGNPAGAGGEGEAAELDDQCPASKKRQQSQNSDRNEFQSDIYNSKKKKKREADQCELNENITNKITEKFESNAIKKLVKTALDNQRVKQEYEVIKKRLKEGVKPIDIGKKSTKISSNKVLIKGAHGRYVVEICSN